MNYNFDRNVKRALFVHDHKFRKIEGEFYSTGGLSDKTLIRYTSIYGKMNIIARVIDEKKTEKKYTQIRNENVRIIDGLGISNEEFVSTIKNSSCIIIRLPSFIGLRAAKVAKKNNIPFVIELVGCPWDALINHSLKGKIVAPYVTYKVKKIVKNANYVSYVTSEFLQKRYPTTGKSINCSNVSLNDFNEITIQKRLKKIKYRNSNDKVIVGTIGALDVKYKGQHQVFKVLSELKKQGITKYEYQLVGGGDVEYLKSLAEKLGILEQINFKGSVPHENIYDWLDGIDLYIQPSLTEGLPRSLIEAMSRGLPAIGSDVGGIPELLEKSYVYVSSKNYTNQIIDKFNSLQQTENLLEQAERNYAESKKYMTDVIERRRSEFLLDFKNNI